ncbi:MAG: NifB/NifX family molybdenum-iron cluster-binding protein [Methanobrevibacter sp.]|uniref:NifB/NifX family molybdenum-iron cluster-binding protein n=1 Tax=Methanobrevibacter sp. TaxID=66852 RepID=UPI0026E093BB|nr:NifB/NifX family molybdenum-iron cluster-binding protein [Methanobrevibacter sp.]MDO5848483.1 NifB/NifX family molybdenum-iron cluster-binding protein [Methanobrevibacter sp.]
MRIAVASTDGKTVNLHLGKANSLYIYDWSDKDGVTFVERRELDIKKSAKHQGSDVLVACEDCDVIISEQYGFKTKLKAEDLGIKLVVEEETPVMEAVDKYIRHYNFMHG